MKSGEILKTDLLNWLEETHPNNWSWTGDHDNQIFWTKDTEDIIGHCVYTVGEGFMWKLDGLISEDNYEIVDESLEEVEF